MEETENILMMEIAKKIMKKLELIESFTNPIFDEKLTNFIIFKIIFSFQSTLSHVS